MNMFNKSGFFVFVLTILQVSARYKNVVTDLIDDEINPSPATLSSSRIVSGWEAQPGQHPHHAALRMVNQFGGMRTCGGSIISNVWVLSTAPCTIRQVRAIVRVGVLDINDSNPRNIFETTEWYYHPNYNILSDFFQPYGVTLLKLPRPVAYTWLVKPIRIQSSADTYRNYDGELVYTSGHGRIGFGGPYSNMLRWVYLRAISNDECLRFYSRSTVFETTICARYFNVTTQSTCNDDQGGPLVLVGFDGVPTLIGVSYFGRCDGSPSGFHRPGAFIPWFKELTGIDFDTTTTTTTTTTTSTTTSATPTTTTPVTSSTPTTTTTTTTPATITIPTTTTTPNFTTITIPTTSTTTPTTTSTITTTPTTTTPIPTSTTTLTPTTLTPAIPTSTSTTITSTTTDSDQGPEDFTLEDNTTAPPEDSEEKEEEEESDNSDSNENENMAQLLKRLQVDVKVKVAFNKYKVMKVNDTSVMKH